MDDSLTLLNGIIQRHQRLYQKNKKYDFYPKFRKIFERFCNNISELSNFVEITDFEKIIGSSKEIPLAFIGHQEELIDFLKNVEELKKLNFNQYETLKIIKILTKYLKNDNEKKKLEALMQILERLIII